MPELHFEDIWNEAETLSKRFPQSPEELVRNLHTGIDKIPRVVTLGGRKVSMVIGQIIFDLAALAQLVDRPDDPCNVAAGMRLENETRKAQLLDPEE